MQRQRWILTALVALTAGLLVASTVLAQNQRGPRGRGRGGPGGAFGRFGGGGSLIGLLRNDAVRKEIETTEDQEAELQKLAEQLRGERPQERPNFREMSEEERDKYFAEMRQRMEQRAKEAEEKLAEILLPHQLERLRQISLQVRGVTALLDPKVAEQVGLSQSQRERLEQTIRENNDKMREEMRKLFQSRDRQGLGEKIQQLRKENDEKVLALLTADQRAKFKELQGEPFEMPRPQFGGRGRGPQRGGEGGRGRPQRPQGPRT